MEKQVKLCGYRNCKKELVGELSPNTKYCKQQCRYNENTYLKRARRKIKKNIKKSELLTTGDITLLNI